MTETKEKDIADQYKFSRVMTAGRIQSIILLVDKASELLKRIDLNDREKFRLDIIKCQNIIAQLEMALNFRGGLAVAELFGLYEQIYTCLAVSSAKSLNNAKFLLAHFRHTLRLRFGR